MNERERLHLEAFANVLEKRAEHDRHFAGLGDKSNSTLDEGRARGLEEAAFLLRTFLRTMNEDNFD